MITQVSYVDGGVVAPKGFLAAGVPAGLKRSGNRDLCLLVSQRPAECSAVYTTNAMAAAPIGVTREHLADGRTRAVVINAGNANACTGAAGANDARAMAAATASALALEAHDVGVASTGVIGVPLPMEKILAGIAAAANELDNASGDAAAEAIMTTDTFSKQLAVRVSVNGREYTVGGMAKGSGMIRPDMATMLAFLTTDAPLSAAACRAVLTPAVSASFHRITVDGETSTNDMCMLIANGAAGGDALGPDDPGFVELAGAITHVCEELARMIARDGEGATKLVTVTVTGAAFEEDAWRAAMAIAESPLVKCAVFGSDPNWGRVISALGASGAHLDPCGVSVSLAGFVTARGGTRVDFDEAAAAAALDADEVEIDVDLGVGDARASVWTCDLTYDYVRINAEYDRLRLSGAPAVPASEER